MIPLIAIVVCFIGVAIAAVGHHFFMGWAVWLGVFLCCYALAVDLSWFIALGT